MQLSLPLIALALTANVASLHAQIEHGSLNVIANGDTPNVSKKAGSSKTVSVERVNQGDYHINFSRSQAQQKGVLITTISENYDDSTIATSAVFYIENSGDPLYQEYFIPVNESPSGAETDQDVSFAFFPYDTYTGGYALNASNNAALSTFIGSAFENGATVSDPGATNGIYTLDLAGVDANYTSDKGVLLVSGGRNEDNYALSRADNDGTFTVWTKDNGADTDTFENDPFTFVYLPLSQSFQQIPAFGRIKGDGSKLISQGDFTVAKIPATGHWLLTIPHHSDRTGTLILSPEGGDFLNKDNIWSAQYVAYSNAWLIEGRDIEATSTSLQDLGDEPAFSFAFVTKTPVYVDADATGTNDGSSWGNAYTSLWNALQNATPGDQFWVAQGIYLSSDSNNREHSIELRSDIKLYGGFNGTETLLSQRKPKEYKTIISGDIGVTNDPSDNAFHVITAAFQTSGYNIVDGFTVSGGNAYGSSTLDGRGAGALVNSTEPIDFVDCRFIENTAAELGGAIYLSQGAEVTFTNCSFKGNQAASGGSLYVDRSEAIFINCVFQGNYAASSGGAIYSFNSEPTFYNCSIQGNRAAELGGALTLDSGIFIRYNTVLWGNQTGNATPPDSLQIHYENDASNSGIHNLIQGQGSGSISELNGNNPASDPMFLHPVDPAAAPTTEGSLALLSNSPLIYKGQFENDILAALETDIAGYPRVNVARDIGAYEAGPLLSLDNAGAAPGGDETVIENWLNYELNSLDDLDFEPRSTHGDIAFIAEPALTPERALTFNVASGTTGFARYRLTLRNDASGQAPTVAEFTIKAGSQTIYVDPSAYSGDRNGSSWANAASDIVTALEYSQSGDVVYVTQGTYYTNDGDLENDQNPEGTFALVSGVKLYGGFPSGGSSFQDRDPETFKTTLSGYRYSKSRNPSSVIIGTRVYHVVSAIDVDDTTRIDGFTIQDGSASGSEEFHQRGSAILCINGSPAIENCRIFKNRSLIDGAIALLQNSAPKIANSVFEQNSESANGAAIYVGDSSLLDIEGCSFSQNSSSDAGGAIYLASTEPAVIRDSNFTDNESRRGGALYIAKKGALATVEIFNCVFTGNQASIEGGAIWSDSASVQSFRGSTFAFNTSDQEGGAIYNDSSESLSISDSIFEYNQSASRDAGAILHYQDVLLSIEDSVFRANSSPMNGGAIVSFEGDVEISGSLFVENASNGGGGAAYIELGNLQVDHSQFLGNSARNAGGALNMSRSGNIRNSLFSGNRSAQDRGGAIEMGTTGPNIVINSTFVANEASSGASINSSSVPTLLTNSIVWANSSPISGQGLAPESSNNIIQGLPGGFDPLFVRLPDPGEGGWENKATNNYGNLRLQSDSPAIDAGVNPDSPAALDLGGNARIQNSTIDIGPYEGHRADYYYLFGHLDPEGDYNGNGLSNYYDYAAGVDPEDPIAFNAAPLVSRNENGIEIYFAERTGREDVYVRWETSSNLEPDSWRPLAENDDYTILKTIIETDRKRTLINLGSASDTPNFYRQVFTKSP